MYMLVNSRGECDPIFGECPLPCVDAFGSPINRQPLLSGHCPNFRVTRDFCIQVAVEHARRPTLESEEFDVSQLIAPLSQHVSHLQSLGGVHTRMRSQYSDFLFLFRGLLKH